MTGETEERILRPFSIEDIPWETRVEHFGGRVETLANSDRDNLHLGVVEMIVERRRLLARRQLLNVHTS